MADVFTKAKRSWIMSRVSSRGTRPEQRVAEALKAAGIRFGANRRSLPGSPDIVLPRLRLAIFIDGCFWHWHGCVRCRMPASNQSYWRRKISGNVCRDKKNRSELHRLGWSYMTIWECDLNSGIRRCLRRISILKRQSTISA